MPGLGLDEKELLMFLLGPKTLQYYVVSPSFEDAEQRALMRPLPAALPVLKDAYLAYASVLKLFRYGSAAQKADEAANLRRASAAMLTLRTLPITSLEDAALCLALGTVLAVYVYAAIGVGVSDICHYCLSTTQPFFETATLDPETEPRLILLVLLETMECMVHRRKPTLRIQSRAANIVDRRLGLCVPLLPYYHDLCVISHSLANATDAKLVTRIQQQLDKIHAFVEAWQPCPPEQFVQQFSSAEVVHLLAQARIYRLAALLMAHRLRHAFGEEDGQADMWSREVIRELELTCQITSRPVRFVTLPFIIAAVELRDPVARIKAVQDLNDYVDKFTPVVQEASKVFLWRVWHERDVKKNFSWFDSVHKPCVVLESIEASLVV